MIVNAHHRNANLAARHLSALRREFRGRTVELLSRRNAAGRYSTRGHSFVYEVGEAPPAVVEYVAHFDYEGGKARDLLRFQVHVFGPGGTADHEALQIIRKHFSGREAKRWPEGWKSRTIHWGHVPKGSPGSVQVTRRYDRNQHSHIRRLAFAGSTGNISKKREVASRKNRRAGRKAKKR